MKVAYVDTSCLVAVAFGEPGSDVWAERLAVYDEIVGALRCRHDWPDVAPGARAEVRRTDRTRVLGQ